jgi:5-methylcytosine-specific restriction endonuclease McrA
MRNETRYTAIPAKVKQAVAIRDEVDGWPCCLICGTPAPPSAYTAFSCAHFIPRSAGGKGVEENVITLCPRCHSMYDQGIDRGTTAAYIEEYLKSKYPHWDKELLIYKKGI